MHTEDHSTSKMRIAFCWSWALVTHIAFAMEGTTVAIDTTIINYRRTGEIAFLEAFRHYFEVDSVDAGFVPDLLMAVVIKCVVIITKTLLENRSRQQNQNKLSCDTQTRWCCH